MEKGNFVYSGWRANGFVALVGLLVLIAGGIALCVFGSDVMDPRIGLRTAMLVCGVCLFFISYVLFSRAFMFARTQRSPCRYVFSANLRGLFTKRFLVDQSRLWGVKKISVRCPSTVNVVADQGERQERQSGDDRPGAGVENTVRTRSTGPCSTSTPRRWAAPILRFRLRPV